MDVATDVTLHSTLVRLATLYLKCVNGETPIELINTTQHEIAGLIGPDLVVSRHIQELNAGGAITVSRKKINVKKFFYKYFYHC
jgi:hypothetical protein